MSGPTDHDRLLDTSEIRTSLGQRTALSGMFVSAGRGLRGIVSLTSVAILARLLTPADFGVLAMVLPVSLIASMTLNMGLHIAVLHEEQLSTAQVSHLFWRSQRFNALLLGAMALSAPLLAMIYREPRVTAVTLIWTLALAFQAVSAFPEALIKRQMRFGLWTLLDSAGMVTGAIAAIVAASFGLRSSALALQFVVWNAVRCVGAVHAAGWSPRHPTRSGEPDQVVGKLVRYGADFGTFRAIYWLGRQLDRMVVGYLSGAAALGLYESARRWSWYPLQELFLAISDVVVASLSRARHDAEKFREYCRRGFTAFLSLPLPAIAFVAVEAELVVRVLLGEQWLGAVPMVRIMCWAAFIDGLSRLTTWLYTAEGTTRQQLRWSVVNTLVMVTAVLAVAHRGAMAVTWAFATSTAVLAIPTIGYCLRASVLTWRDFLEGVWRPTVSSVAAAGILVLVRGWLPASGVVIAELVVNALVFGVLYAVAWIALPGGVRATREMVELVRAVGTRRQDA